MLVESTASQRTADANAPSARQLLTDALVATWSAEKAVASETCGPMYVSNTTEGGRALRHRRFTGSPPTCSCFRVAIASGQSSSFRKGYEALEQEAGLHFEASAAAARGFSEAESTGTTTGTMQLSSELQATQTRLPQRSADKRTGGENAEKIAKQMGTHENRPIRARVGSCCVSCERVEKLFLVPLIGFVQHSGTPPAEELHASVSNAGQT